MTASLIEPEALVALLKRVEEATGSDREIDCAIACHLDGFWAELMPYPNRDGTLWRVDFCRIDEDGGLISPGHGGDQMVRRYSASLDAALSLVERVLPGTLTAGCDLPPENPAGKHMAGLRGERIEVDAFGPTRPLALLAALLRALIASRAS